MLKEFSNLYEYNGKLITGVIMESANIYDGVHGHAYNNIEEAKIDLQKHCVPSNYATESSIRVKGLNSDGKRIYSYCHTSLISVNSTKSGKYILSSPMRSINHHIVEDTIKDCLLGNYNLLCKPFTGKLNMSIPLSENEYKKSYRRKSPSRLKWMVECPSPSQEFGFALCKDSDKFLKHTESALQHNDKDFFNMVKKFTFQECEIYGHAGLNMEDMNKFIRSKGSNFDYQNNRDYEYNKEKCEKSCECRKLCDISSSSIYNKIQSQAEIKKLSGCNIYSEYAKPSHNSILISLISSLAIQFIAAILIVSTSLYLFDVFFNKDNRVFKSYKHASRMTMINEN